MAKVRTKGCGKQRASKDRYKPSDGNEVSCITKKVRNFFRKPLDKLNHLWYNVDVPKRGTK